MSDSIIGQLGGPEVLLEVVKDMYGRVFADPELSPFFENVDREKLQRMQYEFLVTAFRGPVNYSSQDLQGIHAGRGITEKHFSAFVGHFANALESRDIDKKIVDAAVGELALFRDRVIGKTGVDG